MTVLAQRPSRRRTWATMAVMFAAVLGFSTIMVRLGDSLVSRLLPAGSGDPQTIAGVITDTLCGPHHNFSGAASEAECVHACARRAPGATYALYDGKHVFPLDDRQAASKFAAQKVLVTGRLNQGTIHVESITPSS